MALKRKFGNRYYYFDSQHRLESHAEYQAKALRKAGNKARITTEGKGYRMVYIVWVRG